MKFNLRYYPVEIRDGAYRYHLPGLIVFNTSRTAHRHRRDEIVTFALHVGDNHEINNETLSSLLAGAKSIYERTQGSVTHAIQAMTQHINAFLMKYNSENAHLDLHGTGNANSFVIHKNHLFVGQVGSALMYIVGADRFEKIGATDPSNERLGGNKRFQIHFTQTEIHAGDLLLMCPKSPDNWTAHYLSGSQSFSAKKIKSHLLSQVQKDFKGVFINFLDGAGKIEKGDWEYELEDSPQKLIEPDPNLRTSGIDFSKDTPEKRRGFAFEQEVSLKSPLTRTEKRVRDKELQPESNQEIEEEIPVNPGETEPSTNAQTNYDSSWEDDPKVAGTIFLTLARIWMETKTKISKMRLLFHRIRFLNREIPPLPISPNHPPYILIFSAVILPLLVIISAASVYTRTGKEEQFHVFFDEAVEKSEQAKDTENIQEQYQLWQEVLDLTWKAENFLVNSESRALYENTREVVDDMDLAARLEFRPAMTQFFPEEMEISKITPSSSGIYVLDSVSGSVHRVFLNPKGFYQRDAEFSCAPGTYGLADVGKIVDFEILAANEENFKVLAVDNVGNLLYCQPGQLPVSRTLPVPEDGWGRILTANLDETLLYIFDAEREMMWIYKGKDPNDFENPGIVFSENPDAYFSEDKPDMGGVIDVELNKGDIYFLHADGHITLCQSKNDADKEGEQCRDPEPYTDNRISSENKHPWIFMGTSFIQMQKTTLPYSGLFILDSSSTHLYQFSTQLNVEKILKPNENRNYPLPKSPPTGFGISSDLDVFIAFGNKFYKAALH